MFTVICLAVSAVLVGIDQAIKLWAVNHLSIIDTIPLIPNVLHLTYQKNYGAAFSILHGKTSFLIILTSTLLLVMLVVLLSRKIKSKPIIISISLILAGGVGNLVDRLMREGGFVVDYIDFRLIHFPVFNFADICVVSGTILLMIYLLFLEGKETKE